MHPLHRFLLLARTVPMTRLVVPAACFTVCLLMVPPPARAGPAAGEESDSDKTDKEHSAEAKARPADMPLSPLPDAPSLELPAPRPEAVEAIEELLGRIVSEEPLVREKTQRQLLEAKVDWVAALAREIDKLAERADRRAMSDLLDRLIDKAREDGRTDDSGATEDYLSVALAYAEPESETWRDLTRLLALSRMLRHLGTTPAARELIRIYVRFGDFMRIDVQRQLDHLGDRGTAALLEAERHPAQKIARWAGQRLDLRGQAIAHEAVRTEDDQALADILVALGRTRDPDATRILISFAGTEQSQVREAARQGIALMGEVAAWQLRDAYLDITGKRPPREWTWKRTARELFTEYDRLRLEEVFQHFERGQKALDEGKLDEMREAYDQVLALSPLFERREAMASGYIEFAQKARDERPEQAVLALRRAARIADDEETKRRAESLRYLIEAERLASRGIYDRGLFDKAIALDPSKEEALRSKADRGSPDQLDSRTRYGVAWLVGLLSLGGVAWILLRAARKDPNAGAPVKSESGGDQPAGRDGLATDEHADDGESRTTPSGSESAASVPPDDREYRAGELAEDQDTAAQTGQAEENRQVEPPPKR